MFIAIEIIGNILERYMSGVGENISYSIFFIIIADYLLIYYFRYNKCLNKLKEQGFNINQEIENMK